MLKKKITTLLITVALLTSVMPAAFADTTEQPPQMPNGEQPQGDMNVSIPFTDVSSDAWSVSYTHLTHFKFLLITY